VIRNPISGKFNFHLGYLLVNDPVLSSPGTTRTAPPQDEPPSPPVKGKWLKKQNNEAGLVIE
jgi:hypothetical protein